MAPKSRRTFLSKLGVAASAAGATLAAGTVAHAQSPAAAAADPHWQAARHAQDDWFDQLTGKHRYYFDSTTPERLEDAIQFTGNYYSASRSGYGLENPTSLLPSACVIAPRRSPSTTRCGQMAEARQRAEFVDPKSEMPKLNIYAESAADAGARPLRQPDQPRRPGRGLIHRRAIAGLADAYGGTADSTKKSPTDRPRAPALAGIVAVNRAQGAATPSPEDSVRLCSRRRDLAICAMSARRLIRSRHQVVMRPSCRLIAAECRPDPSSSSTTAERTCCCHDTASSSRRDVADGL